MNNKQALDTIYSNLKNGMIYAYWLDNVKFPMYYYVICYDGIKKLFYWRNYGSSANKATKKDLLWIITVIFKMCPVDFIKKYDCLTVSEYNSGVKKEA